LIFTIINYRCLDIDNPRAVTYNYWVDGFYI